VLYDPCISVRPLSINVRIKQLRNRKIEVRKTNILDTRSSFKTSAIPLTKTEIPTPPNAIDNNVTSFFEITWFSSLFFESMRKASIKNPQLTKMQDYKAVTK
jgi:hypothetical protein